MTEIETLKAELLASVEGAEDLSALEAVRLDALGKKGRISIQLKTLGGLEPEERKQTGQALNQIKDEVASAIAVRQASLEAEALSAQLVKDRVDISLPVQQPLAGGIHPLSRTVEEIAAIFADMGFSIAEGPDIETEHYNFNALNIPESHPARQMHDTFYLNDDNTKEKYVLRTHTSPVQVRTMEKGKPPFKFISPGRTYRCDSDQTHTPMFHQIEGLVVDEKTHLGHLKWTLETFFKSFFELDNIEIQLRPSYFPFTEPSLEVDVLCDRSGPVLKIGEGSDWLEVAGAGMVHPEVLRSSNIDPSKYQGFAFGLGVDRLAQLKYGIPDLRTFFNGDIRWLSHYGFSFLDLPTLSRGLKK